MTGESLRDVGDRGSMRVALGAALGEHSRWSARKTGTQGGLMKRSAPALMISAFISCALLAACTASQSALEQGTQASPAAADDAVKCGPDVTPIPAPTRQINLVLDESGSMFADIDADGNVVPSTTWSIAKYSLEVFSALLGPNDQLDVYRMSDYGPADSPTAPTLTLSGADDRDSRVAQIHEMELQGASTPWRSVTTAADNLLASDAELKWLVILTDGEFKIGAEFVPLETVTEYLSPLISQGVRVAFMSIGALAVEIPALSGLEYERVDDARQLLPAMTGFANTIFERTYVDLGTNTAWATDIPLSEVVVFAQGAGVRVSGAQSSNGAIEPAAAPVSVKWTTNGPVVVTSPDGRKVRIDDPVPDESLEGTLADFTGIPVGDVSFDIANASQTDLFYKPDVTFGYTIVDAQGIDVGNVLTADQPYTLNYSFMTPDCVPVTSPLLEPVNYSAQILREDQVVQEGLSPGSPIQLPSADYTLVVQASYNGGTSGAQIPLIVSGPGGLQTYPVSALTSFPALAEGIPFKINVREGKLSRPITPAEWQALDAASASFSGGGNLEYQLAKSEEVGRAFILARAPDGDIFAADTGDLAVTVSIPPLGDIDGLTSDPVAFTVVDDLTVLERLIHWFWTVGIWILVALILLILILGYIFKRRFPKVGRQPEIMSRTRMVGGGTPPKARGKFRVNGIRRWLPFVADKGTLVYVPPGSLGFIPMKLKAGSGRTMRLLNANALAKRNNVQINGTPVDEHFNSNFQFGRGSTISARNQETTFETTL